MEQQSILQWDSEKMLPVKVTDPMGLASALVNNYRLMRPYKVTDPNGMNHVFEFNGLGMVTRSIVQGASGEGDTIDSPTISYSYNLHNWMEHQLPVVAGVSAREVHGSANSRWLTSYTWSDGLGRELQTKVQAEDGEAFTIVNGSVVSVTTDNRWVATGRTVYNNKGKLIKQYEPWFSTSDQYEPEDELCRYGVTPLMTYDPLGRLIRTDFPDGTISRVEFDSWKQKNFDRNDCVANSSWYAVMSIGSVAQQRAATLTMLHNNTPQVIDLDTLGRPVRVTDDNGSAGSYSTYSRLDILGRITQVTDAKGRLITRHFYSIDGQPVHVHNIDSGHRWVLFNAAQKPIHQWDNRSNHIRRTYDAKQQPLEVLVQENGSTTELLTEQNSYGDASAQPYFRGRLIQSLGQEGKTTINQYDFKGNVLTLSTQVCDSYTGTINWHNNQTMGDSFTQTMTFDAMNRPTTQIAPNLQTTAFVYGKGSLLDRVSIDGSVYLTNIAYNAHGQRTDVWFANGSKTRYEYDSDTFRLTRLLTTRNSGVDVLQDVTYTYDPEGNIVQQSDAAQQTYYFNNSVVSPTGLYEYDALYRLIKAQGRELTNLGMATESDFVNTLSVPNAGSNAMQNYTQMFSYDELGNLQTMQSQGRWSRSYIYDNVTNRLLRHEGTNNVYTYDTHGNMTSMPHLSSMMWNSSDMLRSAGNGTFTSYYSYNAAGDRVRKVVEKGNIREERLYLGNYERYRKYVNNILKTERQTVHIIDDRHRFALIDRLTIDNGIILSTATNSIRYQYDNHLGSASLELDQTAAIISYEEYHPFGTTSYRSGRTETEVSQKRYKYVGKERDEETGLYYYGARYYAAWLFRFVSVDPLQFKYPHYTPYQYAGNKPVSYIDLDGLEEAKTDSPDQKVQTYFINKYTGQFLGQLEGFEESNSNVDNSNSQNGIVIRAINPSYWEAYKNTNGVYTIGGLTFDIKNESDVLKIDIEKIASDYKTITTPKRITLSSGMEAIEQAQLLVIDPKRLLITSKLMDTTNNRYNIAYHDGLMKRDGHAYFQDDDGNEFPVIAESHTHENVPLKADQTTGINFEFSQSAIKDFINGPGMSEADQVFVDKYHIPAFAIAMFSGESKGNVYSIVSGQKFTDTKDHVTTLNEILKNPLNFVINVLFKNH